MIAPGIRTAAEQLVRRTAKLPATLLVPPERTIGRRTEECIQAGVILGGAEMVAGMLRRILAEWPTDQIPHIVATGGLADRMVPLVPAIEVVEPDLTITGLRIAASHLRLDW